MSCDQSNDITVLRIEMRKVTNNVDYFTNFSSSTHSDTSLKINMNLICIHRMDLM